MSTETMSPMQENANELLDTRFSLEKLLWADWKEKSIYPTVESAFSPDEIAAVANRRKVSEATAFTPVEQYTADLQKAFEAKGNIYSAEVIELDGAQQTIILGEVGGDLIYITEALRETMPKIEGKVIPAIAVDHFAIISSSGGVFRIDKMLEEEGSNTRIVLLDPTNHTTRVGFGIDRSDSEYGVVTQLPYDPREMGILFHEISHVLRNKEIGQTPMLYKTRNTARSEFKHVSMTDTPVYPNIELTMYQSRQITANEERGAWATGVSILREVEKEIGIYAGSKESVTEILDYAEKYLQTYDTVPYSLADQPEDKLIPTFSQENRKASREVQRQKEFTGITYQDIPNFDEESGQNIANNPNKILSIISDNEV